MRRTANHLFTSPNSAQLEMRILANHGADKRFAFLRGRWSRAWKITKSRVRLGLDAEKTKEVQQQEQNVGLGGLSGYGDSDASDSDDHKADDVANPQEEESGLSVPETTLTQPVSEDSIKQARRARAKEWAERRRALKAKGMRIFQKECRQKLIHIDDRGIRRSFRRFPFDLLSALRYSSPQDPLSGTAICHANLLTRLRSACAVISPIVQPKPNSHQCPP